MLVIRARGCAHRGLRVARGVIRVQVARRMQRVQPVVRRDSLLILMRGRSLIANGVNGDWSTLLSLALVGEVIVTGTWRIAGFARVLVSAEGGSLWGPVLGIVGPIARRRFRQRLVRQLVVLQAAGISGRQRGDQVGVPYIEVTEALSVRVLLLAISVRQLHVVVDVRHHLAVIGRVQ